MRSISVITIILLFCAGCQSVQVRNHSVELEAEVPTLYNQLVLNNIATAIAAPENLPYFGEVLQSQSTNARQVSAGATPTWQSVPLHTLALPFTGSDQNQAAIQLTPVNAPEKLELLHELFRAAACSCCNIQQLGEDFDTLKRYYNAHKMAFVDYSAAVFIVPSDAPFDTTGKPPQPVCIPATGCQAAHFVPGQWPLNFQVRRDCWFCVTDKHGVPKSACVVGNCCDTYVWVPAECAPRLRLLTLAALDIASVDLTQLTLSVPPRTGNLKELYDLTPEALRGERFGTGTPRSFPNYIAPAIPAAPLF